MPKPEAGQVREAPDDEVDRSNGETPETETSTSDTDASTPEPSIGDESLQESGETLKSFESTAHDSDSSKRAKPEGSQTDQDQESDRGTKPVDSHAKKDPAPPDGDAPRSDTWRWTLRAAVALLAVIAVVSTVFAAVFGWKLRDRDAVDTAAQQALTTAEAYAATLTSIDAQNIDQDFTQVLNGSTGDFKNMYSQSSNQLKTLLVANKAVSKGKVVDASIKSASTDRVEVMLFVDQQITNTVSPDPRVDRSRIVMTMQLVGGRWLASRVDMV